MPIPIPAALDDAGAAAAAKAVAVRSLPRYLASAALAGAFVGIAVVLLVSVSAPLAAAGSPAAKLVQAAVFGVALTLVVFAGAELFTGNAMVMLQGLRARAVTGAQLAAVWAASLVGNLLGSLALASVVHGGGTLTGDGEALVAKIVGAKDAVAGPQLFWRSVLCNLLVCLGLWMAGRVQSDVAKAIVLWWALLAFIGSGFEHSIANMTIFGLGILEGSATAGQLARNLAWTVPGNIVGGGLLVGLAYAWIGRPGTRTPSVSEPATPDPAPSRPAPTPDPVPASASPVPAPAYARTGATA
ncbi:MAG TPA: formate/nitrite transporter family protein [Acidimicrobiales bacterium]|nr:formate/nitrite transporter family protein [Acidimicrobiales bacterium]